VSIKTKKVITILGNISEINNCSFGGSNSLKSITIPEGVTRIGVGAFYDCITLNITSKGVIVDKPRFVPRKEK
jgi:hypothetical protein